MFKGREAEGTNQQGGMTEVEGGPDESLDKDSGHRKGRKGNAVIPLLAMDYECLATGWM